MLLAAATALAASCASYQPQPLHLDETAAALEARRLDTPELRGCMEQLGGAALDPWPPREWGLATLTAAAFCYSTDLAEWRAALATARAGLVTAGARLEPAVALTAEYQSNAEHGLSPWTIGPTVDVPLTTAGKREIRIARARNLAEAARLDLMAAAWTVRSRLRAALVEVQAGDLLVRALRAETEVREALVRALEAQRAAGAISAPEVAAGRAELESLRIELASAESGAAVARTELAAAIGVPAAALSQLTTRAELPEPRGNALAAAEHAAALQQRADVLAALARYEAAQDDLRLAIAEQYPDLHLGPGFLWDQGASRWQLGLSLALPLLNRNRGPIAEAEARRAEAAAQVEALQAGVVAAIDAAGAQAAVAAARVASADALTASNQTLVDAAERARAAGESSRLDVLLATAGLERARRVRVEAWRDAQRALGQQEDAVQRPLAGEPLPPVPLAGAGRDGGATP